MTQPIMVACDLHEKTMVLKIAEGQERPQTTTLPNTPAARGKLIAELQSRAVMAGGARIIFAYEASALGFGLYDEMRDARIECHVLAPTLIPRSPKQCSSKTDHKDAHQILEVLRGHVLAGNALPDVWVPDRQTRDDRELVRTRLNAVEKAAVLKTQVQMLLKRNHV